MNVELMTEIFENPYDLSIIVKKTTCTGKFSFCILRDPLREPRTVLASQPMFDTLDIAINRIEKLLKKIFHECAQDRVTCEDYLTLELIEEILDMLHSNQEAHTYKLVPIS